MKKLFTYLVLGTLFITQAEAQTGLAYRVMAIPQVSVLQGRSKILSPDLSAPLKASFGAGVTYNFTGHFGVGADVLYSLQGHHYTLAGKVYNKTNNYIKVPVYFIYNTNTSGAVSFIVKAGEQITFITRSTLDDKEGHKINSIIKAHGQTAIFGGMASAGTQFKITQGMFITTALRFDYDFQNSDINALRRDASDTADTYTTTGVEVALTFTH